MAFTIDPRVAELLGHDTHLPAVDPQRFTRASLIQRFEQPPIWHPDIEVEKWFRAPDPVPASVLVPLVMRGEPSVLLTQRTSHLKKHAGQISFPGGRSEPTDPDAIYTALREAQEEVGLAPSRVDVLGTLPTYTTGTGFVVTPVVGLIEPGSQELERLQLNADPSEVAEIFEVPLHFLMDPRFHQRRAFDVAGTRLEFFSMPWTSQSTDKEYFIWGATAAMLRNLYRFLSA
ncbi:MAG: CoA pyrophosphatase [Aquabacterium sp.]|uniref:CoA pyrophosphatase n=1 Tax=Aquabacterium sp. TaxID=1872578 RepID=UPI0025C0D2E5|nr:CoA pyrophosphatase [Aquabacterium sp.]MBI3381574.1 CoA pyrophosphatase [Aquabacterium sp.]